MADVCTCPVCETPMRVHRATLAPGGPIGTYWKCENPQCPNEGIERMWPDREGDQ